MNPTVLLFEPNDGSSSRRLLGMTLRERLIRSCLRDGAVAVRPLSDIAQVQGPVVIMPATVVGEQKALKALLQRSGSAGTVAAGELAVARFSSTAQVPALAISNPEAWLRQAHHDAQAPAGYLMPVTDRAEARRAEDALLQSLRKPVDGLVSRSLNRPISLATTRYLARTFITPNHWTVFTGILGILGAAVMAQGGWLAMTAGAFMIHMSSVWDGCDGELARIKFLSSKVGEWLDTIADDIVNSSLTLGLGLGLTATTGDVFWQWLAFVGVGLYAAYTTVVYHHLITRARTGFALDFKWWFEKDNAQANTMQGELAPLDLVKLMLRRDFFVFAYFVLTALTLASVALWCAFVGALAVFVLASAQIVASLRATPAHQRTTKAGLVSSLFDAE